MRPWVANLIGLVLGFTIGGEALFIWYSRTQQAPAPPAVVASVEPPPPKVVRAPPVMAAPEPQPIELPRIESPLPSQPLPTVIYPEEPAQPHKPGSAVAGTGFFVASDGSLITAAHVVNGCRATRIASQFVHPTSVLLVASDTKRDVALLRAEHVTSPATLPVGRPAAAGGRLFVLRYPANGGPLIPTEAWGHWRTSTSSGRRPISSIRVA